MRLAPTIDPTEFPEAERSALRLDGDCRRLGLTVVPVDVPLGPAVRAASLADAVARHDLVVELLGAAWVHGAVEHLPRPLPLALDVRTSPRTKMLLPAPREARFRSDDAPRLGGVRVTTPLKTAFDLLRLPDVPSPDASAAAAALLRIAGTPPSIAAALAQLQQQCPHKQRGIERLAALPVACGRGH
ncbi:hypothetical protein [uncultured Amnibacterium sp.]|uniref:hypothetical protein n=1 Tax=uncultured Amnibacterium sp. TaxID=1631851 RepID=UPI0035CBB60E